MSAGKGSLRCLLSCSVPLVLTQIGVQGFASPDLLDVSPSLGFLHIHLLSCPRGVAYSTLQRGNHVISGDGMICLACVTHMAVSAGVTVRSCLVHKHQHTWKQLLNVPALRHVSSPEFDSLCLLACSTCPPRLVYSDAHVSSGPHGVRTTACK